MHDATKEQPFRLQLIFYDEIESLQAVPLNGVPRRAGDEATGGMVRGKKDLVSLISEIGIDSVVQTRQVRERPLTFEHTYCLLPPSQIVDLVEERFAACHEAEDKILADRPLTGRDVVALSFFECIVLGSTKLSSTVGFQRMREWFERRSRRH
jgi:hypothetical protein